MIRLGRPIRHRSGRDEREDPLKPRIVTIVRDNAEGWYRQRQRLEGPDRLRARLGSLSAGRCSP